RAGDTVSVVEWSTNFNPVLAGYPVSGPNDAMLLSKVDALVTGGGTDLSGGLNAGYSLAANVFDGAKTNRVVLISDGGANVGITDEELIGENAAAEGADGIYLVGIGV